MTLKNILKKTAQEKLYQIQNEKRRIYNDKKQDRKQMYILQILGRQ